VSAPKKFPDELRARTVRLYRGAEAGDPAAGRAAGVHHEALRNWIRQAEADAGERTDRPSTDMAEENRRLLKENAELRRANEILKAASGYLAAELDPGPLRVR
jgi:transposase